MTGFPIIDLVAGMLFIYFLLSVINNSLIELGATILRLRSKYLEKWLSTTFSAAITDPNSGLRTSLANALMDHPLLTGLSAKNQSTSYMSSADFATALIELVTSQEGKLPGLVQDIEDALQSTKVLPESLRRTFLMYLSQAKMATSATGNTQTTLDLFHKQIQNWFDNTMNRVSGIYKRKALLFSAVFATAITISCNIDSLALMNYLYSNPQARQNLASAAFNASQNATFQKTAAEIAASSPAFCDSSESAGDSIKTGLTDTCKTIFTDSVKPIISKETAAKTDSLNNRGDSAELSVERVKDEMMAKRQAADSLLAILGTGFPMGWTKQEFSLFATTHGGHSEYWLDFMFCIGKLPGFLMTILAICLGAPFWFDVLSKVANIRNSLKPVQANQE